MSPRHVYSKGLPRQSGTHRADPWLTLTHSFFLSFLTLLSTPRRPGVKGCGGAQEPVVACASRRPHRSPFTPFPRPFPYGHDLLGKGALSASAPPSPSSKRSHHQHRFRSIDWWPTARKMWTSMDVEHSRGGVHKGGHLRPTERDKNATRQRRAGVGVDRSRASAGPVGRPTAEASCSAQHLVWWPQARQPVPAHPPGPFLLSSPVTPDENASQSTW